MFIKAATQYQNSDALWVAQQLKQVIIDMKSKGVTVKAIICDNAAVNVSALKLLNGKDKTHTLEE